MKKSTTLLVVLLFPILLMAQEATHKISATVLDEQQEPMVGVSVATLSADDQLLGKGTTTDVEGRFELEMKVSQKLRLSYVGYENKVLIFNELQNEEVFELSKANLELTTIVVTADGNRYAKCFTCNCHTIKAVNTNYFLSAKPEYLSELEAPKWKVFPNPATSHVQVETSMQQGFIHLISTSGQLLQKVQVRNELPRIELTDLPAGFYLLQYEHAGAREEIGKVVKVE